jgi:hypothetical protein
LNGFHEGCVRFTFCFFGRGHTCLCTGKVWIAMPIHSMFSVVKDDDGPGSDTSKVSVHMRCRRLGPSAGKAIPWLPSSLYFGFAAKIIGPWLRSYDAFSPFY